MKQRKEWNYQTGKALEHLDKKLKLKVSGNIGSRHQTRMKEKIKKEYFSRTRKLLESKFCSRNLITGINTWAVHLIRYSISFLKWTKEEVRKMDKGRTLRKMDKGKTQKNGPENKKIHDDAQEKRKEKYSSILRIA